MLDELTSPSLLQIQFEILYSAALFPHPSTPTETARKYRQNFMSNAREIIRITGGKGVIFSSGPGGSAEGLRGPMDLVNLWVRFFGFTNGSYSIGHLFRRSLEASRLLWILADLCAHQGNDTWDAS